MGNNTIGGSNIFSFAEWLEGEVVQTQNWVETRRSRISNAFHLAYGAFTTDVK